MEETIFIPQRINVGYQKRSDTYTGQLAYIIYYDQKNKLRKEASWQSWRDNKIDPNEFNNVPTSGFVLNKKVGDYQSDWHHRSAYCRVYDPRNFEFEITIQNLLYILENTNSIKGKGLEGEFVYGWSGTDLLLIPTLSPDYVKIVGFTDMISKPESIKGKDLVLGGIYRTSQNKDWIYLGRFEKYNTQSWDKNKYGKSDGLHYFFYGDGYQMIKSPSGKIVKTVSTESSPKYAELMDKLQHKEYFSPINPNGDVWEPILISEKTFSGYLWMNPYLYFNNEYRQISVRSRGNGYFIDISEWNWFGRNGVYDWEKSLYRFHESINHDKQMTLKEINNNFKFFNRSQYLMNGQKKEN